jgi:hypothetical protein
LLLVILDVIQIDSLNPIAEIVFVDVGVSREVKGNGNCLGLLEAKVLKVGLIIELLVDFVENKSQSSLCPQHHVATLPEDLRPLNVNL